MTRRWRLVLLVSLIGNLTIAYVGYKAWDYRSNINYWLDKYLYVVDEFSCTDQYRKANERFVSDTIVPGRIVFFGSQVIEEWTLNEFFPDNETINRGVTGQRAAGFLLRYRPDVLRLGPEYVVFEISSYNFRPNTRPSEIFDYVVSMAELAQLHGIKPILTTCIPPRHDYVVEEHEDYSVKDTVAMYSGWVRDWASAHQTLLADWERTVVDESGYLRPDLARTKVDLNRDGYEAVAATVTDAMQ